MAFSDGIAKTTDKLIKKFGNTIALVEVVKGAYDPATGQTNDTQSDHPVKGVISNYSSSELIPDVINMGDMQVMVYADSFVIDKSWLVKIDGVEWNIINVIQLTTQDERIYYELQIRA